MAIAPERLHRITADVYERMAESGLLPERGIELIDGLVVAMSPKGDQHRRASNSLNAQFVDQRRARYEANAGSLSLRLGPHEPSPTSPSPAFHSVLPARDQGRMRSPLSSRSPIRRWRSILRRNEPSTPAPESQSIGSSTYNRMCCTSFAGQTPRATMIVASRKSARPFHR